MDLHKQHHTRRMTPEYMTKCVAHWRKGNVSPIETANWVLANLESDPQLDEELISITNSLPQEIHDELRRLIDRIADNHFRWTGFYIGKAPSTPTDPEKLRWIWSYLHR